ncbi:Aminotransferase-like, plant mobile domain [Sesbania bispinosa]|nr:Aminotransferase-like, plant mobile domain [Sesbania bispinosa]
MDNGVWTLNRGSIGRGALVERVRPTASARQRKRSQHVEQQVEIPPTHEAGYEGGPWDTTFLRSYEFHVAQRLWTGEDRGALKVLTHGRKLKRPEDDYIRDIIDDSGLGPLIEGTHSMIDRSLISAFTERWHRETSSFHLPVGEMTITLEDVSSLLHLPVIGRLFSLLALGCTIFADKSATIVRVTYLELFRDLSSVGNIAWGATAPTYLYEQLKDASCHNTRQLAGYSTLLQAWILEHFPHIMHIEMSPDYVDGMPLCRRLRPHRPVGDVVSIWQYLDRIHHEDIIWTPLCHATVWSHTPHPSSPHDQLPVPPMSDIHHHYLHYQDHLLDEGRSGPIVTHAGECTHGYLDWFRMVSHPYIMPHQDRVHDPLPPTLSVYKEEAHLQGLKTPLLMRGITQRLQAVLRHDMITTRLDGERLT